MQTYVSRNLTHNNTLLKLPFYPHGAGHYTLKKGYKEYESKEFSPFVAISWIEKGDLEITLYGKEHILHRNDVLIYLPGEERHRRVLSDDCEYRWVTFSGERAPGHILSYGYDRIIRNAGPCPVELFRKIMEHISDADPFMQRMIISWVDQILAHAGGRYDNTIHFHPIQQSGDQCQHDCRHGRLQPCPAVAAVPPGIQPDAGRMPGLSPHRAGGRAAPRNRPSGFRDRGALRFPESEYILPFRQTDQRIHSARIPQPPRRGLKTAHPDNSETRRFRKPDLTELTAGSYLRIYPGTTPVQKFSGITGIFRKKIIVFS